LVGENPDKTPELKVMKSRTRGRERRERGGTAKAAEGKKKKWGGSWLQGKEVITYN